MAETIVRRQVRSSNLVQALNIRTDSSTCACDMPVLLAGIKLDGDIVQTSALADVGTGRYPSFELIARPVFLWDLAGMGLHGGSLLASPLRPIRCDQKPIDLQESSTTKADGSGQKNLIGKCLRLVLCSVGIALLLTRVFSILVAAGNLRPELEEQILYKHLAPDFLLLAPLLLVMAGCLTNHAQEVSPSPPEVVFTEAVQRDLPIYLDSIGQTRGSKEVQIMSRVAGFIQSQHYKDGSIVKQGQVLYTLDPRPFQAALAQAQGQLSQAQVLYEQAKNDVARYQPLAVEDAISKQQLDNAISSEHAAAAAVEASQASVQSARINLAYTTISSPVNGLAAISNVTVGALVGNGQNTILTTVSTVHPIRVRFPISEREYLEYRKRVPNERAAENAQPDIHMTLADGTRYRYPGKLTAAEGQIDPNTGTLTLESEFPNPDAVLRPGQYARIRIQSQVLHGAILVPQRAVQEMQGAYIVGVIGSDNKVEMRPIQLGSLMGSSWIVEGGLKAGDRVVIEGVQKIRNGSAVTPRRAVTEDKIAKLPSSVDASKTGHIPN